MKWINVRKPAIIRSVFTGVLILVLVGTLSVMTSHIRPAEADPREQSTSVQESNLTTPWTGQVNSGNALPEYPRPQLVRQHWQNLNGLWDYLGQDVDDKSAAQPEKSGYKEHILVPYPPESELSGIKRHNDVMWYRKAFQVSADFPAQSKILLHFGAIDQTATIWFNGQKMGEHAGGYTEFSIDITTALHPGQEQELVVKAEDRSESSSFPVGKQRSKPGGIFYTGSSGIWQTVWLEPVPTAHISRLTITPSLTQFSVTPKVSAPDSGNRVVVTALDKDGKQLASAADAAGKTVNLVIPEPRLWSPEDPWLYDLTVKLLDSEGKQVDEVKSYGGLRTVSTVHDSQGRPRIAINGKITFLHGPLDQGFWPDGLYTAPTDEALRSDLVRTKEWGFNFVRKHVKVEPARWYYWADKLGLLVWQDMPSLTVSLDGGAGTKPDPAQPAKDNYRKELSSIVDQLRNSPSIIGWVPFNEGWGEFDTTLVAASLKNTDRTRLVIASSGVNCCFSRPDAGAGDVYDDHTYVGPGRPGIKDNRATVDGEYGGLGLVVKDHVWPGKPNAYEMTADSGQLTRRYVEVSQELERVIPEIGLSGAIYTQTTDVENEVNGFLTYDRRVEKMDFSLIAQHNRAVITAGSRG